MLHAVLSAIGGELFAHLKPKALHVCTSGLYWLSCNGKLSIPHWCSLLVAVVQVRLKLDKFNSLTKVEPGGGETILLGLIVGRALLTTVCESSSMPFFAVLHIRCFYGLIDWPWWCISLGRLARKHSQPVEREFLIFLWQFVHCNPSPQHRASSVAKTNILFDFQYSYPFAIIRWWCNVKRSPMPISSTISNTSEFRAGFLPLSLVKHTGKRWERMHVPEQTDKEHIKFPFQSFFLIFWQQFDNKMRTTINYPL